MFTECTTEGNFGTLWCATNTTSDGLIWSKHKDWGVCSEDCTAKGIFSNSTAMQ